MDLHVIESTFQREGSLYLVLKNIKDKHYGLAKTFVKLSLFFWTIFILDLIPNYTDKCRYSNGY